MTDFETSNTKLPSEAVHLQALERMRVLDSYYKWTKDRFRRHIGRRVLDAGCGVGNFMSLIALEVDLLVGLDLSKLNVEVARERFRGLPNVQVHRGDLDSDLPNIVGSEFDTVVLLDVLEHVEDDVALLEQCRQVIQPEGHLLIKVPACPWLFGAVDEASGHFRRYSPGLLRQKVESANWSVLSCRYMNIAGVIPYWIKSVLLRRKANFSRTFSPLQLRLIRGLVPLCKWIDSACGPPVGQSLVLVARRSKTGGCT
jgi:SAM-dependent methyltransferase